MKFVYHNYNDQSEEVSEKNLLLDCVRPLDPSEDCLHQKDATQNLKDDWYHQPCAVRNIDQHEAEGVNNKESGEAVNEMGGHGCLIHTRHLPQSSKDPDA